jgi:hypothetical protein
VDLEARAEMEDTLLRMRSEDSLEELDVRDEKKAARTMKPVSFDVYWHVVYANETKQGGYVSYVPLLPPEPCRNLNQQNHDLTYQQRRANRKTNVGAQRGLQIDQHLVDAQERHPDPERGLVRQRLAWLGQ